MAELTRDDITECLDDANATRRLDDLLRERGYKIVPIEATSAMVEAATPTADQWIGHSPPPPGSVERWINGYRKANRERYSVMVAAAPDVFEEK